MHRDLHLLVSALTCYYLLSPPSDLVRTENIADLPNIRCDVTLGCSATFPENCIDFDVCCVTTASALISVADLGRSRSLLSKFNILDDVANFRHT